MNIEIKPEETGGEINVPPSKSLAHRAILAASLANGTSRIDHVQLSQDIRATIDAARAFGAQITTEQENEDGLFTLMITGTSEPQTQDCLIDCAESGSTVRFLIPILALDADNTVITGQRRLSERPLTPFFDIFDKQSYAYEKGEKELPLILNDALKPGVFELAGDISSQFITGLMFAAPLLEEDSIIRLTSKLESEPYITLTIEVLKEFGITVKRLSDTEFLIPGNQAYRPTSITVDGDFSQAAFWFVNGLINAPTVLKNLKPESLQGDFEIVEIINRIGGHAVYDDEKGVWTSAPAQVQAFEISVKDIPDLLPILAVAAALASGTTHFKDAGRLRIKESDRIMSTAAMLRAFGVEVREEADGLWVDGREDFKPAVVDSCGDHRIAMAAAIASGRATGPVKILGAESVKKSYPNFWDDFEDAGGQFDVR